MKIKIKLNNYTRTEKFFLFIWSFYSVVSFLSSSELKYMYNLSFIETAAFYITIISLALQLFVIRHSMSQLLKYTLFCVLVALIEISASNKNFLVCTLFILVAQNVNAKKVILFDVKLKIISFICIVGLCLFGVIDNYTAIINGIYKNSVGFSHPNTFTCFIIIILLECLYLRFEQLKIYDFIIQITLVYIAMQVGGGRTSAYTYAVILLLFFLAKYCPKIFSIKIVKFMCIIITPLMAFLSYFTAKLYSSGSVLMKELSAIFSGRIYYNAYFLSKYPVKLLGQEVEQVSSRSAKINNISAQILDNAYIRCALLYGVIFLIFLCIVYSVIMYQFFKMDRLELVLFCLFFVVAGFGESYMLNVLYNISMLYFLGIRNEMPSSVQAKTFVIKSAAID